MKSTTTQHLTRPRLREGARIVWALFAKDALEALKNKNTIMVIFSSLLMVFFYRGLSNLGGQNESLALRVYDAGSSGLVSLLENSQHVRISTSPSEEKMKQFLANG